MVNDQPKWRTGKLCYIEIPAVDVARSAEFYRDAFGWTLRQRGDGATSFDDTVNQVSGTFVTGRPPATEPGFLIYVMVADLQAALDPAGNVLGIYQQPGLAETEANTEAKAQA
jgi:predicted enzyme related to lactoylglutathione lyase